MGDWHDAFASAAHAVKQVRAVVMCAQRVVARACAVPEGTRPLIMLWVCLGAVGCRLQANPRGIANAQERTFWRATPWGA